MLTNPFTQTPAKIAVIGLGYVGLPLAVAFAAASEVVGFDIKAERIAELRAGADRTLEVSGEELAAAAAQGLRLSSDPADLAACNVFIVTVPTPINRDKSPDLTALIAASRTVGAAIARGGVVIFESTVYPGATEEDCVPVVAQVSGLVFNRDFFAGYSPERANPGDPTHRLANIVKVTAGSTPEAAEFVDALYRSVVTAGTHRASSIRVAEAAKVIENTQRDLNIALVNEFSLIFQRLGVDTSEVLAAAATKWNFLNFRPGLVGGHCIGVDPYYLTHKAEHGRACGPGADGRNVPSRDESVGRPGAGDGPGLQGELPGPAQHPRGGYHCAARRGRRAGGGLGSVDRRGRGEGGIRAGPDRRAAARRL